MEFLVLGIGILIIYLWISAFFDLAKVKFSTRLIKALFLLLIFCLPILGSIIYFQMKARFIDGGKRKFSLGKEN